MNPFQTFYNMKMGVVDLSVSKAEVIPLDQEQVIRYLGGAAMNSAILEGYESDALVVGTGPLTGSFALVSHDRIVCVSQFQARLPRPVNATHRTGHEIFRR